MRLTIRMLSAALAAMLWLLPHVSTAQEATDPRRAFATRAELEAEAQRAQREGKALEAAKLRHRLTEGDFREGDRILFSMRVQAPGLGDTLIVRAGRVLQFPSMADFPLTGVLRSELSGRLAAHLSRYVRDTSIRVMPLVRLAILGSVRSPGFYYVPADVPLSDVLMRAGGPDNEADLGKITVRREGQDFLEPKAVRVALADGLSADRLHLEAGDQVVVGARRRFPWQAVTSAALIATSTVVAIISVRRNREPAEPSCP
jgi:hypothetical protein